MKLVLGTGTGTGTGGKDGEEAPTPAALDYIADNILRPSLNTLPPNAANAGQTNSNNGSNISF